MAAWLTVLLAVASSAEDKALHVVMLSGSAEYESDVTLGRLKADIETTTSAKVTLLKADGVDKLPGLEALDQADVAVFFTRRLTIDGESLDRVKKYVASGRPIVGIRTASHGFQRYLEFDKLVLGGNYQNHFKNGLKVDVRALPEARDHPVLKGLPETFTSLGSLYKNTPLSASDATILLRGKSPESDEPVAWVREHQGRRVFYTSLGAQSDFHSPDFRRMLVQAIFWAARRDLAQPEPALERAR